MIYKFTMTTSATVGKGEEMSFSIIETQEQLDAIIGERVARAKESARKEYEGFIAPSELDAKTKEFTDKIASLEKSLSEANEKVANYDKDISERDAKIKNYEVASVKSKVANELGLTFEAVSFINGDDEASIRQSAEALASIITKPTVQPLASAEPMATNSRDSAFREMLNNLDI